MIEKEYSIAIKDWKLEEPTQQMIEEWEDIYASPYGMQLRSKIKKQYPSAVSIRYTQEGMSLRDYEWNELGTLIITEWDEDNAKRCWECDEAIHVGEEYIEAEVFDSPFDKNGEIKYFHMENEREDAHRMSCWELSQDTGWSDFRLFECPECDRLIYTQNPNNGWMSFQRTRLDEDGEYVDTICLSCYEKDILENGIPRVFFEKGQIPGMFAPSVESNGYEEVEDFQGSFIRDKNDANRFCKKALELIDSGYKIVVDYDRMAIGGIEGYVSMYAKLDHKWYWKQACEHDGIDPDSKFAVFSNDNPFQGKYENAFAEYRENQLVKAIFKKEE